jgi:hypothetical protein
MRESIPALFGPVGDDRHTACLDRCEANLSRCSDAASAQATDTCNRNYEHCIENCDRREGVMKV